MYLQFIIVVAVIVFISFLFLGFNIFFRKKKFPDFHISHNKNMQKLGIKCAKHEFMTEYYKEKKKKINPKNIRIIPS